MEGENHMQFQASVGYAIRILQYLYTHTEEEVTTAHEISQSVCTTYPFATRIVHQLKQKGLVSSVQGRYGGYRLARPAREISVYDIVLAMQGELGINHCLRKDHCGRNSADCCGMQDFFQEVQESLIARLSSKNIADFDSLWS